MNIAVVILNWNGKDLLKKFLPSVITNSEEAQIYVADNNSTDESVAVLKISFPEVNIIQNKSNNGYAGGYNEALKSVSEEIIILLNSDVEVTRNWLVPILEIFQREADVAAIQPKILDYKKKDHFEYAGAAGGYLDQFGYPFCRGRIFQKMEEDKGQYDDNHEIFWASGACFAIRNSVYQEAGGLDEDFFAHQEEIDLCWRIQNMGYRIKYTADSVVYHVGGATLSSMDPKKTYYNFRNGLFLLLKNLKSTDLLPILFGRMILDGVAALKFLSEGKVDHFTAILKAHGSFYSSFNKIRKKRPDQFKIERYYKLRSIVYQHFILRKARYGELEK
ncbi:glycosyltransferase family 2 protein [Christiangramia sp. OXR-203]|uniref:glycosyltransferase family 2 protein n=1 Tax=Christiangramia sp. OXR-203 TaxID=3100176 RepID=UPI002AC9DEA6|nr:glycosyltransferase family 2 protein [Christiangramia sp. OXR-203]WPY99455.1 glycosyltransferase family 2 protein [Christiangramia sp. OXR-203]